jgi:hypothetical protein
MANNYKLLQNSKRSLAFPASVGSSPTESRLKSELKALLLIFETVFINLAAAKNAQPPALWQG